MKFKIVSDSSANVFAFPGVDFASVPLKINTAAREYVDDAALDTAAMVAEVKATKGKSGTACPNIQEWLDAFAGADRIFAVTITSNLSGSCAAATEAASQYMEEHPEAKVCVLDTLSTGPEMRLLMEKLRQWYTEGKIYEQMEQDIRAYMEKTHLLFSLESLTNLARNGRVNPAVAKIAGVLGIRVVGVASTVGTLQQLHKCRGEKKALQTLFEEMEARGYRGGKVRIAHCLNPEAAAALKEMFLASYPQADVDIEPTGGLCCFYAEQGGLLVGFETA
jgi:DegV family protein with EDD domain